MSSPGFANAENKMRSLSSLWRDLEARTSRAFERQLEAARSRLRSADSSLAATDLLRPLTLASARAVALEQGLRGAIERQVTRSRGDFAILSGKLDMLSPLRVLGRGYLLAQRTSGQLVTQARELTVGDLLRLRFADGDVGCEITETADPGR
jgi:exodeoxyribonuclease VII large subunit